MTLDLNDGRNKNAAVVHDALPWNRDEAGNDPDDWATVADLVVHVGKRGSPLSESQVRKQLARLESAGHAERWNDPDDKKAPTLWRAIRQDDDTPDAAGMKPVERPVEAPGDAGGTGGTREPSEAGSDDLSAVIEFMQSERPMPDPPARDVGEAEACTHPGCGALTIKQSRSRVHLTEAEGTATFDHKATTRRAQASVGAAGRTGACTRCGKPMTKSGRSWLHDDGDTSHKATSAKQAQRTPREPGQARGGANGKAVFGRGELERAVLAFLRDDSTSSHKPNQVAKALNAHVGSTAYTLDKLTNTGEVNRTSERPKAYQAA